MRYRPLLVVTLVGMIPVWSGCGSGPAPSGVAITATDTSCQVARTAFAPGPVSFTVTNKGDRVTEVYVYGEQGGTFTKVIAEVENIGPGLTRDLTADLGAGQYEIACKPGQTGSGIRTRITVSGAAPPVASATGLAGPNREIEIEVTATGVAGADGLIASTGEKIEFKLTNQTTGRRELEIIDPAGTVAAEVEAGPNGVAETVVAMTRAGQWSLKIEGSGVAEVIKTLQVS